jgi:hypothetical protein
MRKPRKQVWPLPKIGGQYVRWITSDPLPAITPIQI